MAQTAKVKKSLEVATKLTTAKATQTESKTVVAAWYAICDDPETSNDLRSLAVTRRRELEGAIARENTGEREAALAALAALAANTT